MEGRRCYLCRYYKQLIEHPEDSKRHYYIMCKINSEEHPPCYCCDNFEEGRRKRHGGTYSLEERV